MKNCYTLLLFSSILSLQPLIAQNKQETKLDSLIQKIGEKIKANPQLAGLSMGVYHKGERSFYNFGTTEIGKTLPPTENTIYEIGSITKTFASLLLANAVAEKKVKMEDDIRKYLDGEYPNLEYNGNPIKLINLANTTSGLPDWLPSFPYELQNAPADSVAIIRSRIYGSYTRKDFYDALHKVKLDTVPGLKPHHSNAGAQLLAYILERVYKAPFEQLIQTYITAPLEMRNTAFLSSAPQSGLLAKGYNEKGTQMPYDFTMPYFKASGGLSSCTADLLKYVQLQLDENNKAIQTCHQRTLNVDVQTGKVVGPLPEDKVNASVYSVGLNWFLYKYDNGYTQIWADGGTSGFCSYLVIYPELKSGVVILSNEVDQKTFNMLPGIAYEIFQLFQQK